MFNRNILLTLTLSIGFLGAIELFTPNPIDTYHVFWVPVIFILVTRIIGHKKLSEALITPLFILTLSFYVFGGHVVKNEVQQVTKVSQIGNIQQLTALVDRNAYSLPQKIDPLTTLIKISVIEEKAEYELTLMLHDIDIKSTNREILNQSLSDGLLKQCGNEAFKHLHKLGIKIAYNYIDMNQNPIGRHFADLSNCNKTTKNTV